MSYMSHVDIAKRRCSAYDLFMEASPADAAAKSNTTQEVGIDPMAFDPVIELFKRDIDFSIVERNLALTIEQRAEQLVKATRFIDKFRPLVADCSAKMP